MATILSLKKRVEKLDTDKLIGEVIDNSTDVLADLNAQQINSGLRSDDTLMPDYALRSVIQFGKPAGPIRLRDKGDWQSGLFAKADPGRETIIFGSTDKKDELLTKKYGPEIEGLSEKFRNEAMIEKIAPEFKKKINEATGLLMK